MSESAKRTKPQAEKRCGIIRLSGGRILRWIIKPRRRISHLLASLLAAVVPLAAGKALALDRNALPTDGSIKVGSGSLGVSGNQLTVLQNSGRLGIDWQSFNIGADARVNFIQPGRDAIALNRVVGNSGSEIYGRLSANGQVFLTNPNGILFAPGASVDVGGLVASTLDLSQQDFAAGRYAFSGGGSGGLINRGNISAADGGYIALFGQSVRNEGAINVRTGSVHLAAGSAVTVDITGSGLLSAVVQGGDGQARIDNTGAISATGGSIKLNARSVQQVAESLVNNSGVIRASSLENRHGEIWLTGGIQITNGGTLDVSAGETGQGGTIIVKADMDHGRAEIGGSLLARGGAETGDGGFIETSGARVAIDPTTLIDTRAANGRTGDWLIDPNDYTIAASGGDITGAVLGSNLDSNNVTILSDQGGMTGNGDIFVNDAVSWNSSNTLTLSAYRNVEVNAAVAGSGGGSVVLRADNTGTSTGTVGFGAGGGIALSGIGAKSVDLYYNPVSYAAPSDYTGNVTGAATMNAWMLVNDVGQEGGGTLGLQAMSTNLSGSYALGRNVDASATASWNGGAGFTPIGTNLSRFVGKLDGQGHTITGLTINRPSADGVALIGYAGSGATLANLGMQAVSIVGNYWAAPLVGYASYTTVSNSHASGNVSGGSNAGGLIGKQYYGMTSSSYSSANVDGGSYYAGGLVGYLERGTVADSYATGAVTAYETAGGLVGESYYGTISNSHASGAVASDRYRAGGLVGGLVNSVVTDVHATGDVAVTWSSGGGLVGESDSSQIAGAYATGAVAGQYDLGGLIGYLYRGSVSGAHATGRVSGTANDLGGLVGYQDYQSAVTDSYATGEVVGGVDSAYVGGLIGRQYSSASVSDSYATGAVSGKPGGSVGALFGASSGAVGNVHYNLDLSRVNGEPVFTRGGLYQVQFDDWVASGKTLDIADYAATLAYDGASGSYGIGGVQGLKDLLGFTETGSYKFKLTADLDLAGLAGFHLPIFAAQQLDGDGHTLANLTLARPGTNNVGFIGQLNAGSSVSNLTLASASVSGAGNVGVAVGNNLGTLSGVSVNGTVSGTGDNIGGLVGSNSGTIDGGSSAVVAVNGVSYVGGLVGNQTTSGGISNAHASGTVVGTGERIGGLAGSTAAAISNSSATGNVSGTGSYLGGLVGYAGATVTNSYAEGSVSGGAGSDFVGGLVGYLSGAITNSHSTGDVVGKTGPYTGALIGYNNYGTITNSRFNIDSVLVNGESSVGVYGYYQAQFDDWLANGKTLDIARYGATLPYDGVTDTYGVGSVQALKDLFGFSQTAGLKFRLTADIDLVEAPGYFLPIFSAQQLDGAGHAVSNLTVNRPDVTELGLIGRLAGGSSVSNLAVVNANITGYATLGGLVGVSQGTISNVVTSGSVTGASNNVGGLVGYSAGPISNSSSSSTIAGSGNNVGGLVGHNQNSISNSAATGSVAGGGYVGGLVGQNAGAITNSSSIGAVTASTTSNIGPLVGYSYGTVTNSSYNIDTGTLNGQSVVRFNGYYQAQFEDWLANGKSLDIARYGSTLPFDAGSGTYRITSIDGIKDLLGFSQTAGLKFLLAADLDLSAVPGYYLPAFSAQQFDGGGHTLSNWALNRPGVNDLGFIGQLAAGSSVSNLTLANASLTAGSWVGGMVGRNSGTLSGVGVTGSVIGQSEVGGLVGSNSGVITGGSFSDALVSGTSKVGGLVGNQDSSGSINVANASGDVSGTGSSLGGLVGQAAGTISGAHATGAVSGGSASDFVGGLVGYNTAPVSDSYATGVVAGKVNGSLGPLFGYNSGTITNTRYSVDSSLVNGLQTVQPFALYQSQFDDWASDGSLDIGQYGATLPYDAGTDSYRIASLSGMKDLLGFSETAGLKFLLTTDLDLAGLPGYYLGNFSALYLDGGGHTLGNLTVSRPGASNVGFIGQLASGSTVRNLGFTNATVSGAGNVGAVVGNNLGALSNVSASGTVVGTGNNVGGLAGVSAGTIDSGSSAAVAVTGANEVGGLVGFLKTGASINNASATGAVSGNNRIGGLVGNQQEASSTISNSFASGSVTAGSNEAIVGGLVGYLGPSSISDSYATGNVTASNGYAAYARGVGGLVGHGSGGSITRSYATGTVTDVSGGRYAGGLVGYPSGFVISASYATGSVSGSAGGAAGRLFGFNPATVVNTYYDIDGGTVNGQSVIGPYGLYSTQFADWLSNGKTLDIARYSSTLPYDSVSGAYQIGSLDGLKDLLGFTDVTGLKFQLTADLDLAGLPGYYLANFKAQQFDGAGHTLANLNLDRSADNVGFIAYLPSGSALSNLTLANVDVSGRTHVGGAVGISSGTISGVAVSGTVRGSGSAVGGLAGWSDGTINGGSHADVVVTGGSHVGGLVGEQSYGALANVYATGAVTGSGSYVGGLAGYRGYGSSVSNTYATGTVSGYDHVGGLIGYQHYGRIDDSSATGAVSGRSNVGGLVGYQTSNGWIGNSIASGAVVGTGNYFGGLVGYQNYGTVYSSHAIGAVSGSGTIGGLVGYQGYNSSIGSSYATGEVTGSYIYGPAGGLVGYQANGSIGNSYATGAVVGVNTVGGLVGYQVDGSIGNSYASGSVSGTSSTARVGGLVGSSSGPITRAYASGSVSGGSGGYAGGLVGYRFGSAVANLTYATGRVTGSGTLGGLVAYLQTAGTITNSYWDTVTSGLLSSAAGSGKTTSELQTQATYAGWNFTTDWWLSEGDTRPFLRSEWGATIANGHQLQLMALAPTANYTLARDIDIGSGFGADGGSYPGMWAAGGFVPVGTAAAPFSGTLNGSGHVISGLTINRPVEDYIGLFGTLGGAASVSNLGLDQVSVFGANHVGALAGSSAGTISASFSDGNVVGGGTPIGGLVGSNAGSLVDTYSAGTVSGDGASVAGLAGSNSGTIQRSYADVVLTGANAVGLVGTNSGTVSDSYWNNAATAAGSVGSALNEAAFKQANSYANWDFNSSWRIYEDKARPFLKAFLTPLTITVGSASKEYDRQAYSGASSITYSNPDAAAELLGDLVVGSVDPTAVDVGVYAITAAGLWSDNQRGFDIRYLPGTVTITPRQISVSGLSIDDKVYDGTTGVSVNLTSFQFSNVIIGDDVTLDASGATGAFVDANAGANKAVTIGGLLLGGADAGNYSVTGASGATAAILPKALTIAGTTAADKVYDRSTAAAVTVGSVSGLVGSETVTVSANGAFADWNVGTGKEVGVGYLLGDGTNGGRGANYTLAGETLSASIKPKTLGVSTVTANDKVYDRSVAASLSGGVLDGVELGDVVSLSGLTGVFDSWNVGMNKTVTVSGGSLAGTDAGNYRIAGVAGTTTATITARQIGVSGIGAQDKTYDGGTATAIDATGAQLAAGGVLGGDEVVLDAGGAVGEFADANAGVGKAVTVSGLLLGGADAGNYSVTGASGATATISPKALTIAGTSVADKVYDRSTAAAVTAGSVSGLVGGETLTVSASGTFADWNVGTGKAVGVGYLLGDGTNGGVGANYTLAGETLSASITPKVLTTASLVASDKVYDRTTAATVSGSLAGVLGGDVVSLTGLAGAFADWNVDTGKEVTVSGGNLSGINAGNYQFGGFAGTTTATITARQIGVSGIGAQDKTYDGGTAAAIDATGAQLAAGGVLGGDVVVLDAGSASGEFADANAGANKAVTISGLLLSGSDAGNYSVTGVTGATATIVPKALTIAGTTVADKVYDRSAVATVSAGSVSGLVGGETVTVSASGGFDTWNAGANKAVTVSYLLGNGLNGGLGSNYTLADETKQATITRKTLSVSTVTANDKVYDRSVTASFSGGELGGVEAGDAVSLSGLTGSFDNSNVGTNKTVTVSGGNLTGADANNYQIAGVAGTASASITARQINAGGITAQGKVYNGDAAAMLDTHAAQLVAGGTLGGDLVSLDASGAVGVFADANAGANKAVTIGGLLLGGADAGNYSVADASGATATILPKALAIAGTSVADKVYDRSTAVVVSAGTVSGMVGGETVTVSASGDFDTWNAGIGKDVTVSYLLGDGSNGGLGSNYTLADETKLASINPKALTIAGLSSADKVYDRSTAASVSGSLSGVLAGDEVDLSGLTGVFADKNVGSGKTVTISGGTLGGADAGNYTVGAASGSTTASITAKTLSIASLTARDKEYDRTTVASVSGNLSGVIAGDEVNVAGLSGAFADKNVGSNKTVTIAGGALSGADAGNYTVGVTSGSTTAAITAKTLSIASLTASDKEYDRSTVASVSGNLSGVIAGDEVNLSDLTGSFADKNVGMGKTVTISGGTLSGADAGNYQVGAASGSTTARITARNLGVAVVTASDKVYDGTTAADVSSGTLSGVIAGDDVQLAGLAGNFDTANVGAGKTVTVSGGALAGIDAGNYAIGGVAGATTANITARPLTIAANTVVQLSGESEPTPLGYSVPSGGLVSGDALGSVTVTAPAGSTQAAGTVATLAPSGAVFGAGSASNYNITYANGYLIVLPNPAGEGAPEGEAATNQVLLVQIDEDELKQAGGELGKQQTVLLARRDGGIDPVPGFEVKPTAGQFDLDQIRQFAQRNQRLLRENSAAVIDDLRRQPVILWHPALPEQLFKVSLSGSPN